MIIGSNQIPSYTIQPWGENIDKLKDNDLVEIKKFEKAREFAKKYNKPWIAVSAAHRIENIGLSYIETDEEIRDYDAKIFLKDLDNILKNNKFKNHERYQTKKDLEEWFENYKEAIEKRTKENYNGDL